MVTTDTSPQPPYDSGADMTADEALRLIAEGKTIQNVTIQNLKLTGEFAQAVQFQNVTLKRFKVVDAQFKAGLNFRGCTLQRPAFGPKVSVEQTFDLRGCKLYRADFDRVEFLGSLRLDNAETHGQIRFVGCIFADSIRVWEARFQGWVDLSKCVFQKSVDLRSFHANEGFQAKDCHFQDVVLFRGSTVAKKLEFANCRFDALLDFSKSKLHDVVYLESIEQGPKQTFSFRNALFSRMLVRSEQLKGRIACEEKKHYLEAAVEYGLLKRNFQILNRYDDEDWAFYQFKVNQRRGRPTSWSKPWTKLFKAAEYWFLDRGCGYGAKPFRAVATALVLMTFFAFIYALGSDQFQGYLERPPIPHHDVEHVMNRALFGLLTSVSVFTAGFTGEHLSSAQGWPLLPLAVEALMGTLLWGLFIVTFSRKVIR